MVGFDYNQWKKTKEKDGKWLSKKDYIKKKRSKKDLGKFKKLFNDTSRKIIFDTETTGFYNSDKIVEIYLCEIINDVKTDNYLHFYFNPEIEVPKKVVEIHGLDNDFLQDKPLFKDKYKEIIDFIGDSNLVAHNASFDRRMLNNELTRARQKIFAKHNFIDTLKIARYLYPGEKNTQDILCQRFGLLSKDRKIHSAKQDVELLYQIYINFKNMLSIAEEEEGSSGEKKITNFFLY